MHYASRTAYAWRLEMSRTLFECDDAAQKNSDP